MPVTNHITERINDLLLVLDCVSGPLTKGDKVVLCISIRRLLLSITIQCKRWVCSLCGLHAMVYGGRCSLMGSIVLQHGGEHPMWYQLVEVGKPLAKVRMIKNEFLMQEVVPMCYLDHTILDLAQLSSPMSLISPCLSLGQEVS